MNQRPVPTVRSKGAKLPAELLLRTAREERRHVFFKDRNFAREAMFAERRLCFSFQPDLKPTTAERAAELGAELKGPRKHDVGCLKELKRVLAAGAEQGRRFMGVDGAFRALTACLVHYTDAKLRIEAATCLMHLACWGHKPCSRIAREVGAYLVLYLSSKEPEIQEVSSYVLRNICLDCSGCCKILAQQGMVEAACDAASLAIDTKSEDFVGPDCLFLLSAYLKKTATTPDRPLPPPWFVKKIATGAHAFPGATYYHWFLLNMSSCPDWVPDEETITLVLAAFCAENVEKDSFVALLRAIGNLAAQNPEVLHDAVRGSNCELPFSLALKKAFSEEMIVREAVWVLGNISSAISRLGLGQSQMAQKLLAEIKPLLPSMLPPEKLAVLVG